MEIVIAEKPDFVWNNKTKQKFNHVGKLKDLDKGSG